MLDKTTANDSGVIESNNGAFESPDKKWTFVYDNVLLTSSGRKHIYSGTMHFNDSRKERAACALVFRKNPTTKKDPIELFGAECANLAAMTAIGVGPELFGIAVTNIDEGFWRPTIFEEHAGISLSKLLGSADSNRPSEDYGVLHPSGTAERDTESKKILFDVLSQLINAHNNGLYHRDLRCANVCVRRFGPNPSDIKATIIDFELGSDNGGASLPAKARLFDLLFKRIPTAMMGADVEVIPSPLEFDLGYLAALQYQLLHDDMALERENIPCSVINDFIRFMSDEIDYFRYYEKFATRPFARRLSSAHDLAPYADDLGLVAVTGDNFSNAIILNEARSLHRDYLDSEDLKRVTESAPARLGEIADDLVRTKFESYKALRREQGEPVEYETVEAQPLSLQKSNYAQLAHIPIKVHALGYEIISIEDWEDSYANGTAAEIWERVEVFDPDQVEYLAELEHERWCEERKADGWKPGPRSHENKTTPHFKPYDELAAEVKEYDREAVRKVIPLLRQAGMVVVRKR